MTEQMTEREARQALLDQSAWILRHYYPAPVPSLRYDDHVPDMRRARRLLAQIWEGEAFEDPFDDQWSEEDINALMTWIATMPVGETVRWSWDVMSADEYRPCGCGCGSYGFEVCDSCEHLTGSGCCDCTRCPSCEQVVDDTCSCCENGTECGCCECHTCESCEEPYRRRDGCRDCDRCDSCGCRCGVLEQRREGRPWTALSMAERRSFKSARLCGVEWEINSVEDPDYVLYWADHKRGGIHEDGSCGWEAVTPPMAGDHIAAILGDLGRAFDTGGAEADSRCGIHVHVDASDFYWADMFRLIGVWAHLEPLMYALAGQNRQENQYCRPIGADARTALSFIDRKGGVLAMAMGVDDPKYARTRVKGSSKKSSGRYRSLNIAPWVARLRNRTKKEQIKCKDATVEFRLHRNTLDAGRVTGWTHLLVRLMDWVSRATDADAQAVLRVSALRALKVIAPESMPWVMGRIKAWKHSTRRASGVTRTVQVRAGKWVCTRAAS